MIRKISSRNNTFGFLVNQNVKARLTFLGPRLQKSDNWLGKAAVAWLKGRAVGPWRDCSFNEVVVALALTEKVNSELHRWGVEGYIQIGFEVDGSDDFIGTL